MQTGQLENLFKILKEFELAYSLGQELEEQDLENIKSTFSQIIDNK